MTKVTNFWRLMALLALFSFWSLQNYSHIQAANKPSFSVVVKNQDSSSHVDKLVEPNSVVPVDLTFVNHSSSPQKLTIQPNTALTSKDGSIQYNAKQTKSNYFGTIDFGQIVDGPRTISLEPHQTIDQTYHINIPPTKFDGVIAGGFYVKQGQSDDLKQQAGKEKVNIGYQNSFAYAIPVILKESNDVVHTKLSLKSLKVKVQNDNPMIVAQIANQTPTLFNQLEIVTKLIRLSDNKVVNQQKRENMSMAPLTMLDYQISLHNPLDSGRYRLEVLAKSGVRQWHFTRNLTISAATSKAIQATHDNTLSPQNQVHPRWLLIGLLVVIVLVIIIVISYVLGSRRNNK